TSIGVSSGLSTTVDGEEDQALTASIKDIREIYEEIFEEQQQRGDSDPMYWRRTLKEIGQQAVRDLCAQMQRSDMPQVAQAAAERAPHANDDDDVKMEEKESKFKSQDDKDGKDDKNFKNGKNGEKNGQDGKNGKDGSDKAQPKQRRAVLYQLDD